MKHTNTSIINSIDDKKLLECFNTSTTLNEFYRKIGYSKGSVSKKNRLRIINRLKNIGLCINDIKPKASPKEQKFCIVCGKPVKNLYCSAKCQNKNRQIEIIKKWKETGDTGCQPQTTLRNAIRTYIYEKQDFKCAICGIQNVWNGKNINFILDHIDGNASNNTEKNLRLICPNCNSQLDTYKSKNKKSARNHRKKYT